MGIKSKITILVLVALVITLGTLFFVSDENLTGSFFQGTPRGFPFHFVDISNSINGNILDYINFSVFWFVLSFMFWILVVLSINTVFVNNDKGLRNLFFGLILGLLYLNLYSSSTCDLGFPLVYGSICGESSFNILSALFWGLDLLFWALIGAITIAIFIWVKDQRVKKYKYLIVPIFITLLSFGYELSCTSFICLFNGRGFPVPYYYEGFMWFSFFIDFLIWAIVYFFVDHFLIKKFTTWLIK